MVTIEEEKSSSFQSIKALLNSPVDKKGLRKEELRDRTRRGCKSLLSESE